MNKILLKKSLLLDNSLKNLTIKDLNYNIKLVSKPTKTGKIYLDSHLVKKIKSRIKTISYVNNDTGLMRHHTPAAQEWFNSIYSFNKIYLRTLPSADKNLMKLLKSYFNFFISPKLLRGKSKKYKWLKKKITNRDRKKSTNKVFVGKGELKHTNTKVIVTKYVYNAQRFYLKSLLRRLNSIAYNTKEVLGLKYEVDKNKKLTVSYDRIVSLKEFLKTNIKKGKVVFNHEMLNNMISFGIFWKKYIKFIGIKRLREEDKLNRIKEKKLNKKHGSKEQAKIFLDTVKRKVCYNSEYLSYIRYLQVRVIQAHTTDKEDLENKVDLCIKNSNYSEFKLKDQIQIIFHQNFQALKDDFDSNYDSFLNAIMELIEEKDKEKLAIFKDEIWKITDSNSRFYGDLSYIAKARRAYLSKILLIKYLIRINRIKFKKPFVGKLLRFIRTIYNKKVELNIVNLNKFHLNTDIYTQLVALKLKNRDNKLFRVLTWSLNKVKLPNVSRMTERLNVSDRNDYLTNKIRNMYINSMFKNSKEDSLNSLLLSFFSIVGKLKKEFKKRFSIVRLPTTLSKYITKSLRQFKLAGIRVEAKGRLTRRFTASRSVFKMKCKGGLKNVDSSFKGLSAIMLRGDRKSNVQYSVISSKNRNGAYGVKGWMSSK